MKEKAFSTNNTGTSRHLQAKTKKKIWSLTLYTKNEVTTDHRLKYKTVNCTEENRGENL